MRSLVRELGFPILLGTAQNFKNKEEEVQEYGLSKWLNGKESACQGRRCGFDPWVGKIPWGRKWQPTPVFLPEKSHGQKSLEGYSLRGRKSDYTTHHPALGPSCPSCVCSQEIFLNFTLLFSPCTELSTCPFWPEGLQPF